MKKDITEMLHDEIESQIGNLKNLEPGSNDHSVAVESLAKLYKMKIEEEASKHEEHIKNMKLKEDTKNQWISLGINIVEIGAPLLFYAFWMKKGFKFEETGTFTSTTFRGLVQKFKTGKK